MEEGDHWKGLFLLQQIKGLLNPVDYNPSKSPSEEYQLRFIRNHDRMFTHLFFSAQIASCP